MNTFTFTCTSQIAVNSSAPKSGVTMFLTSPSISFIIPARGVPLPSIPQFDNAVTCKSLAMFVKLT